MATCHEYCSIKAASTGSKMSCPVAVAAVKIPTAKPRRLSNQRLATCVLNTVKNNPEPIPIITPQMRISCHSSCMIAVQASATDKRSMEISIMRFKPYFSTNAAINGPENPYKNKQTAKAKEMDGRLQPKSCSNGSINTPAEERIMPATIIDANVTANTIQL